MSTAQSPGPTGSDDRTQRFKTATTAIWDYGAVDYDARWAHGLTTRPEHDAWLALLERLLPRDPTLRILDVGTGTGVIALLLAELGHDVTGIDVSEGMLAVARAKAQASGLGVRFTIGDAESLPELAPFDAVVSRHLLWTLLRPEAAVRAWSERLRPGGRVIAIDLFHPCKGIAERGLALAQRGRASLHTALASVRRGGDEPRGHSYPVDLEGQLPLINLTSLEPVQNVFIRAGLVQVLSEELTWIHDVEHRVMPYRTRLAHRSRRYLLEGRRPA